MIGNQITLVIIIINIASRIYSGANFVDYAGWLMALVLQIQILNLLKMQGKNEH